MDTFKPLPALVVFVLVDRLLVNRLEAFVTQLRLKAKTCDVGNQEESLIRDCIFKG